MNRNKLNEQMSRALLAGMLIVMTGLGHSAQAIGEGQTKFKRVPTQFIAALGDPGATSGGAGPAGSAAGQL